MIYGLSTIESFLTYPMEVEVSLEDNILCRILCNRKIVDKGQRTCIYVPHNGVSTRTVYDIGTYRYVGLVSMKYNNI